MRTLGTTLADDVMTCKRNSATNISFDFCFPFYFFYFFAFPFFGINDNYYFALKILLM